MGNVDPAVDEPHFERAREGWLDGRTVHIAAQRESQGAAPGIRHGGAIFRAGERGPHHTTIQIKVVVVVRPLRIERPQPGERAPRRHALWRAKYDDSRIQSLERAFAHHLKSGRASSIERRLARIE